jgi:hypothetical protein
MVCEVAMGRPWVWAGSLLLAGMLAVAGRAAADDAGPVPLAESSLGAVALRGPAVAVVPSPPAVAGSPDGRASEAPRLLTQDDLARLAIGVVPALPEPRPARLPPPPPQAAVAAGAQQPAPLPAARPVLAGGGGMDGRVPLPAARPAPPSLPGGLPDHGIAHGPVELDADALVAVSFSTR